MTDGWCLYWIWYWKTETGQISLSTSGWVDSEEQAAERDILTGGKEELKDLGLDFYACLHNIDKTEPAKIIELLRILTIDWKTKIIKEILRQTFITSFV